MTCGEEPTAPTAATPCLKAPLEVVAGVFVRDGHVLLCQRAADVPYPLRWEFPGGKLEPGESPADALHRELAEELNVDASIGEELWCSDVEYPDGNRFRLHFYRVSWEGTPEARSGIAQLRWVSLPELEHYDVLEGDREFCLVLPWLLNPDSVDADDVFMRVALLEAQRAAAEGEVPVGAVLVRHGRILARGRNAVEHGQDATLHAEMQVIRQASRLLGRRLEGCTLYVTLEPCPMCAGAIVWARIVRVVFGAPDPRAGACGTLYNIVQDERLNHRCQLRGGVRAEEAAALLRQFFQQLREEERGVDSRSAKQ